METCEKGNEKGGKGRNKEGNDDEEQPGTRARISYRTAGPHGVDAAEDDEMCSGEGMNDEWLSSCHGTLRLT